MSFDKKLKALRIENKMTQQYVAERLNVARSTIAGYETKCRQPSHEKLTSLAGLFHVTVDYLIDDNSSIELADSQSIAPSDAEKELLARYRRLSSRSRQDLLLQLHLLELRDSETAERN